MQRHYRLMRRCWRVMWLIRSKEILLNLQMSVCSITMWQLSATNQVTFHLAINDSITIDSLVVSYVGYSKTILPIVGDEFRHIELSQCPVSLNELHVPVPKKIKKHTIGKKHSSGLVLSVICDGDSLNPSPTKGETYGFEVHSRKNKSWLTKCR